MKQLKFISTIILLMGLIACESDTKVAFNEPQPVETSNLSKFPKRLQGKYVSLTDSSSTLLISDKLIERTNNFIAKIHQNQIDSTAQILGDTIIDLEAHLKAVITKRDGDSLTIHGHQAITLFQMNYDNVARKFKGYYFLNTRRNETSWTVAKIQLTKGQLVWSSISDKLDIDSLKQIIETPTDTIYPYKITATKKQFKELLKNGGFSDGETFVKQK